MQWMLCKFWDSSLRALKTNKNNNSSPPPTPFSSSSSSSSSHPAGPPSPPPHLSSSLSSSSFSPISLFLSVCLSHFPYVHREKKPWISQLGYEKQHVRVPQPTGNLHLETDCKLTVFNRHIKETTEIDLNSFSPSFIHSWYSSHFPLKYQSYHQAAKCHHFIATDLAVIQYHFH